MSGVDNLRKKKILVSNPGKQYTHQLLFALQKYQHSFQFLTSFWYKPGKFPYNLIFIFPAKVKMKLAGMFKKRYFDKLESSNISQWPYFEIFRELSDKLFGQRYAEKMQYYRDRFHDKWVASRLDSSVGIVIGYEETCLQTFRKAKEKNICTILDLAQVHYKEIQNLAQKHTALGDLYKNVELRKKIDLIKEEELALADYIICLSEFAKKSLVDNGIKEDKIFVSNLGFDPQKFKPKEKYSSSGKIKMIFVGTMTRRKGIDLILKVHEELSDILELTFVGPMADAEDLMQTFKGKFIWHPYVDHEKLNEFLNESDLFVFPSYLDSWAMVVIEAMACGLPVIVSENTGAKEGVKDDSGFIIPAGDIDQLKEKITFFYHHRNELETMGYHSKNASMNYTWDVYYEKIDKIIQKVNKVN